MAEVTRIDGDVTITGNMTVGGQLKPPLARTYLAQDNLAVYEIPWHAWRVWDAYQTNLPGTAASDDLALIGTTFGSAQPSIRTSDAKATTVTQRARAMFCLPAEYVSAETVQIRVAAGMITTVSDGTATIDFEVYRIGKDNSIGSDICATSATTINSLTASNKTFTVTASSLAAGDWLDIRATIAITDTATGTAVIGAIFACDIQCDIKG